MFTNTPYGRTNKFTGEIHDLTPLRYKPRGRVKRPVRRCRLQHGHVVVSWRAIALVSMFVAFLAIGS
jgi:hypothetical protein